MSAFNPTRLMLLGDTHHDLDWALKIATTARRLRADAVVQVGDFGYFPGTDFGDEFLNGLLTALRDNPDLPPWYILDGNHDNVLALTALPRNKHGFGVVSEKLFYIPRAHHWTWSGVTFTGLGGAVSIDRANRVEGYNWWNEETISYAQACTAIDAGPADILFTHDSTHDAPLPEHYKSDIASHGHRTTVSAVAAAVQPKLHVHGHYHFGHTTPTASGQLVGLGMNGDADQSYRLLALPSLQLY